MCQAQAQLAFKENGRWHSDWFNLCYAQWETEQHEQQQDGGQGHQSTSKKELQSATMWHRGSGRVRGSVPCVSPVVRRTAGAVWGHGGSDRNTFLFFDFCSAFNTMQPLLLGDKNGQSRLYFLWRLRGNKIIQMFYQSVVASAVFYAPVC